MNPQPSGLQRSDLNVAFDDESLRSESHFESNDEEDDDDEDDDEDGEEDESANDRDLDTNRNNNGDPDTDIDCSISIVNINNIRHDLHSRHDDLIKATCSGEAGMKDDGASKRSMSRQGRGDGKEVSRFQAGSDGGDAPSPALRPGRRTSGDVVGDLYRNAGWLDFDDRKSLVSHGGRRLPPICEPIERYCKTGKNVANNAKVHDEPDPRTAEHNMARGPRNKSNNRGKTVSKSKSKTSKMSLTTRQLMAYANDRPRSRSTDQTKEVLSYMPTYRMEPDPLLMFKHYKVRKMVELVVNKELQNFTYSGEAASKKILLLCDAILAGVKMYPNKRYKIVVHVTFMEMAGQACMVADRALWAKESDHVAVVKHLTDDMACIVTVHGVYLD